MAIDKKSMYLTRDDIKRYNRGRLVFGFSKGCSKHNKLYRVPVKHIWKEQSVAGHPEIGIIFAVKKIKRSLDKKNGIPVE